MKCGKVPPLAIKRGMGYFVVRTGPNVPELPRDLWEEHKGSFSGNKLFDIHIQKISPIFSFISSLHFENR